MSYILAHVAPAYAVVGLIIIFLFDAKGAVLVWPVFVVFAPAGIYFCSRRCPNCKKYIYTVENMRKFPGGLHRIPIYIPINCPNCGQHLELR